MKGKVRPRNAICIGMGYAIPPCCYTVKIGLRECLMERLSHRIATHGDLDALRDIMTCAIAELQRGFLTEAEINSSRAIMGLDTQLIDDATYFVVTRAGVIAGCGGWSRRATLYGSNATSGRNTALLDPARDPARVRAMYTHPNHVRQGIGRLILTLCEDAARCEGFRKLELMATLSGAPLYRAYGFEPIETVTDCRGGAPVPLIRMRKDVAAQASSSASQ